MLIYLLLVTRWAERIPLVTGKVVNYNQGIAILDGSGEVGIQTISCPSLASSNP